MKVHIPTQSDYIRPRDDEVPNGDWAAEQDDLIVENTKHGVVLRFDNPTVDQFFLSRHEAELLCDALELVMKDLS